ncbi:SMI1/KNR4 family protein [Cytobacillus horneckiae]|uniref:SMI1/KNR4 family protein n=1 Tax=Cytobacillus horneckiae TaxID=549687 RepID=UPI003D9A2DD5
MNNKIWGANVLDEYELNPLKKEEIISVEKKLQVTIPKSYINLLLEKNGGVLFSNKFPLFYEENGEDITINHILGISTNSNEGILQTDYYIKEWGLPENIVLLNTEGPTGVALDYRVNKKDPSILYYDVELELEEKIAESFDEFISRLYRNPEQPYSANILFPEDKTTFTYKEGAAVFSGDNVREICFALEHFINFKSDSNWLLLQIKKLAKNENETIVQEASEVLYRIIDERLDEQNINKQLISVIIELLKANFYSSVKNYSKKIERLLNEKRS